MKDENKKPQLVELTAKRYKLMQLVGAILLLAALALIVPSISRVVDGEIYDTKFIIGMIVALVGGIVGVAGSALAWWHHG